MSRRRQTTRGGQPVADAPPLTPAQKALRLALIRSVGPIARGGEVHLAVLHMLDNVDAHVRLGRRVEFPVLHELLIEQVDGGDHA